MCNYNQSNTQNILMIEIDKLDGLKLEISETAESYLFIIV